MKTQKISRQNLLELYNNVCENWQKEITKLVLFQTTNEIEVEQSLITKAFSEANEKQSKLLNKFFKVEKERDEELMEIASSWNNLLKYLKKKESDILPYYKPQTKLEISINNQIKLYTIINFLNDGWICDFKDNNQYKYYPYFIFEKGSWRLDGVHYHRAYSHGLSILAYLKNEKLSRFMGTNYIKEYSEFLQTTS